MRVVIGILSILLPGLLLSPILSNKSDDRIKNSIIMSLVFVPLLIFFLYYYFSIKITPKPTYISIIFLNLIAFVYWLKHKPKLKISTDYLWLSIISSAVFYLVYFVHQKIFPSGDIMNLFYDSGYIAINGEVRHVFDRNFVHLFPTIIHFLSGLTIEKSYKLYILLFYTLLSQVSYSLSQKIIKHKPTSFLTSLVIIFSHSFLEKTVYIIPFTLATIILFYLIDIFSTHKQLSRGTLIFSFIVWASIFNTHGVISYASLIIIPILMFSNKKNIFSYKKLSIAGLAIFLLFAQPLLFKYSHKLTYGLVNPIKDKIFTKQQVNKKPPDQLTRKERVEIAWAKDQSHPPTIKLTDLPLYTESFIYTYTLPVIVLAIYGIYSYSFIYKGKKHHPIILSSILIYLLTQQEILGVDWLSSRFIYTLSPFIYIFSVYGIKQLLVVLKTYSKSSINHVAFTIFLLLSIMPVIGFIKSIIPQGAAISKVEYELYNSLNKLVQNNQPILITSPFGKWAYAIDPYLNYTLVDQLGICENNQILLGKIKNYTLSQAFSKNTASLETSLNYIKDYVGDQEYFVIVNTMTVNCINPDLLPLSHYDLVFDDDDARIYMLKRKSTNI